MSDAEKFWAQVKKGDGCWEWQGPKRKHGYGSARLNGKNIGAHRVSYILSNGAIPEGRIICHRCDNPPCVRPDHLYAGTPADNTRDQIERGRHWYQRYGMDSPNRRWIKERPGTMPYGEKHCHARITSKQVVEIRAKAGKETVSSLSRRMGISRRQIANIINGKAWVHVRD